MGEKDCNPRAATVRQVICYTWSSTYETPCLVIIQVDTITFKKKKTKMHHLLMKRQNPLISDEKSNNVFLGLLSQVIRSQFVSHKPIYILGTENGFKRLVCTFIYLHTLTYTQTFIIKMRTHRVIYVSLLFLQRINSHTFTKRDLQACV